LQGRNTAGSTGQETDPNKKSEKVSRILIAVPTYESIFPDTYQSIWNLDRGEHTAGFEFVRGYDCATARNRIASKALEGDWDYVLMVDNDVVLPKDALVNLMEDPVDVCLGYYAHRGEDNLYSGRVSICKYLDELGFPHWCYPPESEYTAAEMSELKAKGTKKLRIHGGGMGCALIRTELFRKLDYPWFDWVNYEDRSIGMLSEDLYFCEKCKQALIPVHTDARVGCGHLMRRVQWPE
jgi:glycosyltransferase involved in cell wall biosynthesis